MIGRPRIVRIEQDLEAGTTKFVCSDATEAVLDTGFLAPPSSNLARSSFSPGTTALRLDTKRGDQLLLPLNLTATGASEVASALGTPPLIVYLDQNHWSALSRALNRPGNRTDPEAAAAKQLIELAAAGDVILPLSSAHLLETTEWNDADRRYQLGLTMLRLFRGWVIRHPIDVSRAELSASIARTHGDPHPRQLAITRDLDALHAQDEQKPGFQPADDLPPEYADYVRTLTSAMVTADVLLDGEVEERTRLERWRIAQQDINAGLHADPQRSREQKHKALAALFLDDINHLVALEATRAGITTKQLIAWLDDVWLDRNFDDSPYIGLRKDFYVEKQLNPATRWNDNDLIDMMYLCLGAAYADIVVCERSAASHITQAQRRRNLAPNAFRRLSDAVEHIRGVLADQLALEDD